jgi:hypothetical protein
MGGEVFLAKDAKGRRISRITAVTGAYRRIVIFSGVL